MAGVILIHFCKRIPQAMELQVIILPNAGVFAKAETVTHG